MTKSILRASRLHLLLALAGGAAPPLQVSGMYPSLATFNEGGAACGGGENGIGAVVAWADRLWFLTYSPHCPNGSADKLYALDSAMRMEIRPESVGGTPAGRMVHAESGQLFIGPYAIDSTGRVRVIPPSAMPGRITAWARHLSDPARKAYAYMMEGPLWEVDVGSLAARKLFNKPVPGFHGKGAYSGQGRLVVANNGEIATDGFDYSELLAGGPPKTPEDKGVLAEWDGVGWAVVERRQFTDVTGPGGIRGAPAGDSPLWSEGWDKRSVILKVRADGAWSAYRLPKSSNTYDHTGGWYTEWPRIREVTDGRLLMNMHGMFYDFPKGFRPGAAGGLTPISTHLIYLGDFTAWKGRLVLAPDITTTLENPMAGRSQSNLWFGSLADLRAFGPKVGWGGSWVGDSVRAGAPSDPYLMEGFDRKVLHLHQASGASGDITVEIDEDGKGAWKVYRKFALTSGSYLYHVFPTGFRAAWVRFRAEKDCRATAYLHYGSPGHAPMASGMYAGMAWIGDTAGMHGGLIRPAGHNRNLQFSSWRPGAGGTAKAYYEVDENLAFSRPADRTAEVEATAAIKPVSGQDAASAWLTDKTGKRYRLPKGDPAFDKPWPGWGQPREQREILSERHLLNVHGTFYEMGRESGVKAIRPLATHNRAIFDFCTWRGLLVLSGTRAGPIPENDGHLFRAADGGAGLWFGTVDDLWKLGRPVGVGGPWKDTPVQAGMPSDAYLMTGYERKSLFLAHAGTGIVRMTVEVDFDREGWHTFRTFDVAAGAPVRYEFPDGFAAHWVRVTSDRTVTATAQFTYSPYPENPISISAPEHTGISADAFRALSALSAAADGVGAKIGATGASRTVKPDRATETSPLPGLREKLLPAPAWSYGPVNAGESSPAAVKPRQPFIACSQAAGQELEFPIPAANPADSKAESSLRIRLRQYGWAWLTRGQGPGKLQSVWLKRLSDGPGNRCLEPAAIIAESKE